MQTAEARRPVSRIVPVKNEGELTQVGFRLPTSLVERIDKVAKETGNSRTEVVTHLLAWALGEYEAEKKTKR